MEYTLIPPTITLMPQAQQVIHEPVQAVSRHSWHILNDNPSKPEKICIQCTLRDNLGKEIITYEHKKDYLPGEHNGFWDLKATLEEGYDKPQIVYWTAETRIIVENPSSLVTPIDDACSSSVVQQSSCSKSLLIILDQDSLTRRLLISKGDKEYFFNSLDLTYIPVFDATDEVKEISKRYPPSKEESEGFLEHRKKLLSESFSQELKMIRSLNLPPLLGGIGQGVLIKDTALDFVYSTAVDFFIIAPEFLGGSSTKLLYLTSSNRARLGCEALVSYQSGNQAIFRIWDWALPKDPHDKTRWASAALGYDAWGDYKLKYTLGGIDHEALHIKNLTRKISGSTSWVNEVYLYKNSGGGSTETLHRVWQCEYTWQPSLGPGKYLYWGPLIETSDDDYGETNYIGFAEAKMVPDGIPYLLTDDNSYIPSGGDGFQISNLDPNFSFLAR